MCTASCYVWRDFRLAIKKPKNYKREVIKRWLTNVTLENIKQCAWMLHIKQSRSVNRYGGNEQSTTENNALLNKVSFY